MDGSFLLSWNNPMSPKIPITPEEEDLYNMQENMADIAEEMFQAEPRLHMLRFGFVDNRMGRVVALECLNIRKWKIVDKKKLHRRNRQ